MGAKAPRIELPVEQQLETAAQLAIRARIFFDIWWTYENSDTRPIIIETLNDYSEFFRFDSHANFISMIVHITNLFDIKRTDIISLKQLIEKFAQQGLDINIRLGIDQLFDQAKSAAQSAKILRDNLFAHRNAVDDYAAVFKRAAIKSDSLRELTDIALKIINRLLVAGGQSPKGFTI